MSLNLTNVTYSNQATAVPNTGLIGQSASQNINTLQVPGNLTPDQAGTALLASLTEGDGFTGEITNITQNQITVALSDTVQVTATLSNALSYNIGDTATFTIKENNGERILLQSEPRPETENLLKDQTIQSALKNAGLPVNEENATLVREMMKQQVPIDRETLSGYAKAFAQTPSATPQDTVLLQKMDIPVNEENVQALHDLYRENEGLEGRISELSKNISESVAAALPDLSEAGSRLEGILDSFSKTISTPETLGELLPQEEREELGQQVRELFSSSPTPVSEELVRSIQSGEGNPETVLKNLSELLKQGLGSEKETSAFLSSKSFEKLTDTLVRQEFYLAPKDVSKENVKKLMDKIAGDSEKLSGKLEELSKEGPQTISENNSAGMVRQNVDFMNQLNHFMNYVQIPLKMFGQNTHGDLYVFRNGHKPTGENDELKAALHLDMDHLGPVDVIVTLKQKNVKTDFKVESDDVLTLIEEHIGELNDRLSKLGYHVETSIEADTETGEFKFKKDILDRELPETQILRYSFDVRA